MDKSMLRVPVSCALVALAALVHPGAAMAATLAARTETIGATAQLHERIPDAVEFTVAAAGQVQVSLTDLASPQPFVQLHLLVSRNGARVLSLDAAGIQQFAAVPGTYKVQVVGTPGSSANASIPAGTFNVEVRELTGNTVLRQFADGIAALPAPPAMQSTLSTNIDIPVAGTYTVTFHDRSLPAALALVDVGLFGGGDRLVNIGGPCTVVAGCTTTFTAGAPGSYPLLIAATAGGTDEAGLYSLRISGPGGDTLYSTTQPVGRLREPTVVTLPAAGGYTLAATDHESPAALSALKLRLMQGAAQLSALDASGSVAFTAGSSGTAQLFIFSRAAAGAGTSTGAGIYSLQIAQGPQQVHRDLRTIPDGYDATVNAGGYRYAVDVPATASYRLRLRDLNFPAPLTQLRAVLLPATGTVQTVTGLDIDSTFQLASGPAYVAVIGRTSGAGVDSLLGLSLAPQTGGASLLDQAQGVGPLFSTQTLVVPAAGSYDVTVNDLEFPTAFAELAVAVTRGPELIGQVFGSDRIRFDAQPGTYSLNLLAKPGATAQYATWGFSLADTPAAPVVTLSANPSSVPRQGTTMLNWSVAGATSCMATGGWSGARALSGTEASPALAADTTFTLSCTGDGGNTSQSVQVAIAASGTSNGGGGTLDLVVLLSLAVMLGALRFRALRD